MGNVAIMTISHLREYMDENSLLVKDIAALGGLKPWDISRLFSGERKKPSTRIALGIEKATEGAVPFRNWFEDSEDAA